MQLRQHGFGMLQGIIVVAILGVIGLVAVPKYKAFVSKSQLTEALNIAHASKRKLEMYYMHTGAFPRTLKEAETMKAETLTAPEYVRKMTVAPKNERDVIIKVFLKEGVVENKEGGEQFVYIQGQKKSSTSAQIEWVCGAEGISIDMLPENCRG